MLRCQFHFGLTAGERERVIVYAHIFPIGKFIVHVCVCVHESQIGKEREGERAGRTYIHLKCIIKYVCEMVSVVHMRFSLSCQKSAETHTLVGESEMLFMLGDCIKKGVANVCECVFVCTEIKVVLLS